MLFKIYLEGTLENWRKKFTPVGIPIDDDKLVSRSLHFVNNQFILAEDENNTHYMLHKLDEEYNRWG